MHRSDVIMTDFQKEIRVSNECKLHGYKGIGSKVPPVYGCETCNFMTFFTILARKSKNTLDKSVLDELESYIHAICELEDEGQFDFKVEAPTFQIDKDAAPD